ncbi:MAG: hypothetical protein GY918_10530, partial [Gammaproteobacteria bacterium]|nr:hypothetical protein [Gammaproteobacteria bacterium]
MKYLGDFKEDSTVYVWYSTNAADGSRIGFSGALETADFEVIKDGNATGSVVGVTLDEDFDSRTGIHKVTIDLSADAFYASGSDYALLLYPDETVDSQSVAAVIASWSIENRVGHLTETARANLQLMYDGTGYTDPTGPASRSQVDATSGSSGGSVNIEPTEDNTSAAIDPGSTTKVWATVSGTFANVQADNGSQHDFTDTGNDISHVYGFDVGSGRVGTSVHIIANVNGNADEMQIEAWDHVSTGWEVIGTIPGSGGSGYVDIEPALLLKHTGTGAEIGKVYIQFDTNSTTPSDLSVELCLVSAVSTSDGIANGSTVTLNSSTTNTNLIGNNWNLALGSQAITGSYIRGATVTGISSGTGGTTFEDCIFGAGTYPPGTYVRCGFGDSDGLFTAASDGQYIFKDCFSVVAGSGAPDFTFAGKGATTGINVRGWFGGSAWALDTDCALSLEVVAGGGTTITPAGAEVEFRGSCRALTIALADTDVGNTIQVIGDVGPIAITSAGSGDSATINLYGHAQSVTDGSNGTVNDYMSGYAQIGAAGAGL